MDEVYTLRVANNDVDAPFLEISLFGENAYRVSLNIHTYGYRDLKPTREVRELLNSERMGYGELLWLLNNFLFRVIWNQGVVITTVSISVYRRFLTGGLRRTILEPGDREGFIEALNALEYIRLDAMLAKAAEYRNAL